MRTATFSIGFLVGLAQSAALNRRAALEDCLSTTNTTIDVAGSDDWVSDVKPFNTRLPFTPEVIAVPTTVEQIQNAIACGSELEYKVTPKSGGHSYASLGLGGEDGHLVIELDRMFAVTLDNETNVATVEPGARLGHVATELYNQGGRAISHGTCPGVGISGHALHGGYGMASHSRGLTLDWVAGMNVALANGTLVHTSATENPELYWGMLGAGSNFGVVTSYEFNTFEPPANLTWFVATLPWKKNNSVQALEALEDYTMNIMPAELNMRVFGTSSLTQLEGVYQGNTTDLQAALAPLFNKTGGTIGASKTTDWIGSLEHFATMSLDQTIPYNQQEYFYSISLELKGLNGTSAENFVDYWFDTAKNQTSFWYYQMDLQGGVNSGVWKVDHDLTSYAHRDKLYILQFWLQPTSGEITEDGFKFIDDWASTTTAPLAPADWGMYANYPDTSLNRTTAQQVYWGENLSRLQELKAQYDPTELFYYPTSLEPAAAT
ncbi:Uu.00g051260.m01.CDS01 [Anthostomella pinea]|uniref:Uu.00g051260.m01.CDS01 n=1 Tax=Anthostomella pinea TaxID=933095 RepID=A0AAI8VTL6_9PEZI|nr:Uu.00g051260.m01.CDS01 [Anthostomella pinea]